MRMLVLVGGMLMIAAPAMARSPYDHWREQRPHLYQRGDRQDNVYFGGKVIGRDPDPFIRNELRRHADDSYPD